MINNLIIIIQVLLKMVLIQLPSILLIVATIALILTFIPKYKLLRAYKQLLHNLYN